MKSEFLFLVIIKKNHYMLLVGEAFYVFKRLDKILTPSQVQRRRKRFFTTLPQG